MNGFKGFNNDLKLFPGINVLVLLNSKNNPFLASWRLGGKPLELFLNGFFASLYLCVSVCICGYLLVSTASADTPSNIITPIVEDTKALFEKAQKYFQEKNFKDSKEILNQLVANHPMDDYVPRARLLLAKLQENFDSSVAQFKELSGEYVDKPEGIEAQKSLGDRYYLADKYEDAAEAYKEYVERYEKSPQATEVRYWLASSYSSLGQDKLAAEEYKKVIDKAPQSLWAPKSLLGLGNAYFKLQKYQDAEKQYLRILDKYGLYEELNLVYLKLGETYEMEKKFKQAYASYQTLTERFPKSLEVADAKSRMEELAKAHPELSQVPAATPISSPTMISTPEATPTLTAVTVTPTVVVEATPTQAASEEIAEDKSTLKLTPFHVQIGVYTEKVNVNKAQRAVKKAGYKSYVITVQKEGEAYTYYKVRVGNYTTKSAAMKAAKILQKKTREKAIVVED